MLKRTFSGIIFVSILISAILLDSLTFYILFFFCMLVAIYEFQKLSKHKNYYLYALGIISYLFSEKSILILKNHFDIAYDIKSEFASSLIYVLIFMYFIFVLYKKTDKSPFTELGSFILTYAYTITPFIIMIRIPFCNVAQTYHATTFLGVIILVWSTDTFAYLTGKKIGKHKLFERVSPNKTIEGFIGGMIFTLVTAWVLSIYFTQLSTTKWIGLSLVVSIFGCIGDLVESLFKRSANIKDSGSLIPGHGGILDRFDSLIFASPFVYFYLNLIS